jgi:hypothetical protein
MLVENRQKVAQLLEILTPQIIGQEREGWSCSCGCVSAGPARAAKIDPAGDAYPGQEMYSHLWTVDMACVETGRHTYSVCLSEFLEDDYLKALFVENFGSSEEVRRKEEAGRKPYSLEIEHSKRIEAELPAGIAIQDNPRQTRFIIDWGITQAAATEIFQLYQTGEKPFNRGGAVYTRVIEILKGITDATLYRRGPDPVYPYESDYLMDMEAALSLIQSEGYYHLFMQNLGLTYTAQGEVIVTTDIAFAKFER